MAILAGPASPIDAVISAMARSRRMEPFGLEVYGTPLVDPRLAALQQIIAMLEKCMNLIADLSKKPIVPKEDDFMKGWGEPGGDIES